MTFRLVRVKRRADQEPVEALYLPTSDPKRTKAEKECLSHFVDYRIYKHVNRSETENSFRKLADGAKVVLISELNDCTTVAEAVLMDSDDSLPKRESQDLDASMSILSLTTTSEFVYDMYRIDLGRYSESDIKDSMAGIVTYEQELVNESEYTDSDFFEDEDDSNAEDYYANDYPDEESFISDHSGLLIFESEDSICCSQDSDSYSFSSYSESSDYFNSDESDEDI